MIKRLIFDVDGTLLVNVDFKPFIVNTLKEINVYSKKHLEGFLEALYSYEANHTSYVETDYVKWIENHMGCELPNNFLDIFFKNLEDAIPEYNVNLVNTIKELSMKYELVLLTNYFSSSQVSRLNNAGIGKYFTEYYGEKVIKPYKEAYISACGTHKPSECVMIGDNPYLDIICAKNEGLNTILVNTKKINTDDLNTIVVDKVEDIKSDLIDELI